MLVVKREELNAFYDRWITKAESYNSEELSDYFDKFFSLFVIYNRIYNVVDALLNEQGELQILKAAGKIKKQKITPDNEASTISVAHFLRNDVEQIVSENESEITSFRNIITNKLFNIDLDHGKPQPNKDALLLAGLNSKDNITIVESLLKILYQIRCNIFHAEKGYNNEQRIILKPANSSLTKLVSLLMMKINEIKFPI